LIVTHGKKLLNYESVNSQKAAVRMLGLILPVTGADKNLNRAEFTKQAFGGAFVGQFLSVW
jgi:hypothetical protein